MLSEKLKPQHKESIFSLPYCKLVRQMIENTKKWMDNLRIKANECGCKVKDKSLDDDMMTEIAIN